jgi:hypothetical protein
MWFLLELILILHHHSAKHLWNSVSYITTISKKVSWFVLSHPSNLWANLRPSMCPLSKIQTWMLLTSAKLPPSSLWQKKKRHWRTMRVYILLTLSHKNNLTWNASSLVLICINRRWLGQENGDVLHWGSPAILWKYRKTAKKLPRVINLNVLERRYQCEHSNSVHTFVFNDERFSNRPVASLMNTISILG